jgi:hypothetical protein
MTVRERKAELTANFKGVTAYSQSPAEGVWEDGASIMQEQIILFEVMVENFDRIWWSAFTKRLEATLRQQKIILRWFDISILI